MAVRPPTLWRDWIADEARQVAAGTLNHADATSAELYPDRLIGETDAALAAFEKRLDALRRPSDAEVFAEVEQVVLDLNEIDGRHGAFETIEREQLCEYIVETLVEWGIDVEALAARRGIDAAEITDAWRDW
ncbi:hypothetical protein GCM10009678_77400 [Actinomadura kijaniata]|uniref:Uncharacterized protein n=1 Tax=Actinomadura namibiensis TaxID=182080 RepID=A0A7W3LNM6_ACTNM|nr:hypothetical protein [Actinomadura namibiensis]MBA8951468.1 hypothetical protein [Actinomadura namibiensis]